MHRSAAAFRLAFVWTLLAAQGAIAADTFISIVPIGTGPNGELIPGASINGNTLTLTTDGVNPVPVFLEFRIGDWDPDDTGVRLTGWQIHFDSASLTSGATGALTFNVGAAPCGECSDNAAPCLAREECTPGVCSVSGGPCHLAINDCPIGESCVGAAECNPLANGNDVCEAELGSGFLCAPLGYFLGAGTCAFAAIDQTRADFVLAGATSTLPALDVSSEDFRVGGAVVVGPPDDPVPFPAEGLYGATLALTIPPNAQGTFTLSAFPPPASQLSAATGSAISPITMIPATIRVNPGRCCYNLQLTPSGGDRCIDNLTQDECNTRPGIKHFQPGATCATACPEVCGDNVLNQEGEEQCDGTDSLACPGQCLSTCMCGFCGDNIRAGSEECDGIDDTACPGFCLGDCTCGPFCGDDVVNQAGEECDGSDAAACFGICLADCTCNPTCGDADGDGETDMLGVAVFLNCFTGPGGGPVPPECQCARHDTDDDVDLDDLLGFLTTLTGP